MQNVTPISGRIIFGGGAGVASSISNGSCLWSPVWMIVVGWAGVQSSIICSCLEVPELCLIWWPPVAGVQRSIIWCAGKSLGGAGVKQAGSPGAVLLSAGVLNSSLTGVSQFWDLAHMGGHCLRGAGVHISIMASLECTLGWIGFRGHFNNVDLFFCILIPSLKFSTTSQVSFSLAFSSSHILSHLTSSSSHVLFARQSFPPLRIPSAFWPPCSSFFSFSVCWWSPPVPDISD